jgi:hypothetical protein
MATLTFPGPAPTLCDTPRCTRVAGFYCEWSGPQLALELVTDEAVFTCAEHLALVIQDATDCENEIHVDVMRLTL